MEAFQEEGSLLDGSQGRAKRGVHDEGIVLKRRQKLLGGFLCMLDPPAMPKQEKQETATEFNPCHC